MKLKILFMLLFVMNFTFKSKAGCTLMEFNGNTNACVPAGTNLNVYLHATMFPGGGCVGVFGGSLQRKLTGSSTWTTMVPNVQPFQDFGLSNQSSFNDVAITTQLAGTSYDYRVLFNYNPSAPIGPCTTAPNEVCTTSVLTVNVRAAAVSNFKINNTTISSTVPLNVYGFNCSAQPFTFNSLAAGSLVSAQHKLYWKEANSSGTVIGSTFGNTTWTTGFPAASIDLKTYSGAHLGSAAATGKYWLIHLELSNECGASTIKTGLVFVSTTPSAPGGAFVVNTGLGTSCNSTSQSSPCHICSGYPPTFTVNSTSGVISSYTKKVDSWNGTTWVNVYTSGTLTPPVGGLTSLSSIFMAPSSFVPNSTTIYRFTLTLTNPCGTSTPLVHYFKADVACRLSSNSSALEGTGKIVVSPNPSGGLIAIATVAEDEMIRSVRIYDITGKTVFTNDQINNEVKRLEVDATFLNNGIYIVETYTDLGLYKSKITIQK